jgi:hypothetical protein
MTISDEHSGGHAGTPDAPMPVRLARALEAADAVDRVDGPLMRAARALVATPARSRLLHGHWIGHAAHPLLTDLPLGSWTSMSILDLVGGKDSRRAAERLCAVGLLGSAPTTLTGLAEWAETSGGNRRVGFVHGVGNVVGLGLYGWSYVARRRGNHRLGVTLGLAGAAAAAAAGYLGSHLSLARKVATRHPAFSTDR